MDFLLSLIAGFSIGLCLWETLNWDNLFPLISKNGIGADAQVNILLFGIVGATIVSGISALFRRRWGHVNNNGGQPLHGLILRSAALLFLMPLLMNKLVWRIDPLFFSGALVLVCVEFSRLFARLPFAGVSGKKRVDPFLATIIVAALLFCAYFSFCTIINHYKLGTADFDLGIIESAIANSLRGDFMKTAYLHGGSFFSHHFSPIYIITFPFYALFPRSETLLICQSTVVGFAAIPLYLVARHTLGSRPAAFILASSYLLHPAQHGALLYDFHELAFLPLGFFCGFYFLQRDRKWLALTALFWCLMVKEDVSIIAVLCGGYLFLTGKRREGATVAIISVAWFMLANIVIVSAGGGIGEYSHYYSTFLVPSTYGYLGVLRTIASNPIYVLLQILIRPKILYLALLFLPVAGLPLLDRKFLWIFSYGLLAVLIAPESKSPLYSIDFQYIWYHIPLLYIGTIFGLQALQGRQASHRFASALFAISLLSIVTSWQYGAILNREMFRGAGRDISFEYSTSDEEKLRDLRSFIGEIPPHARVGASFNLMPHLAAFPNAYPMRWYDSRENLEFLLLHKNEDLGRYTSDNLYRIARSSDNFVLLRRERRAQHLPTNSGQSMSAFPAP